MAYCPYCKIQVAGNTCPRCGRAITPPPPPPPQPQQQPMQAAVPGQPAYRPQYQQPAQRPVTYAQQPQAQQYYQPAAAAQPTPPKKSKKGVVIAVVVVVAILILASILYLVLFQEDGEEEIPTITYEELMDDMEISMTGFEFNSYDDGDKLYVTGTLDKIRMADVPPGTFGLKSGPWTILYFESDSITPINSFAYEGDLRSEYTVGQPAKILIHIEKISMMGIVSEYPKEWMDASMVTEYIETPNVTLVFTETSPGNYTGSVTSASDEVLLEDLEIEIYDSSAGYHGWDDGDLTDDSPEEIDVYYGDLLLELNDVNDNDKLDSTDTLMVFYADTGDTITLTDSITDEEIVEYTFT